ncbi:SUMF1/EgtB/PvdO family nonheme iron enzyme [Chelativorans sp. AA-79]|uniref:SUMF1/EgtB/PvdO family nonheme iron enzyme n=1 Tax=Chelativorans sp. AA-79 TaxID=3028735 RepID=UPI0023F6DBA7|nr:SUMF1/EgtB/PvdO family nonheme iron enzyme [Chelativorans sp. AA-79]WEX12475.1 SUMF1/EgtB/PvdO family nonheme iron enzyme [Chelativorans sp. AA-79]
MVRKKFRWGNATTPNGRPAMNTWQGPFPVQNTAEDGFLVTATVTAFQPDGFGLYNTCGNVWEWARDLYAPHPPCPFPLRDRPAPCRASPVSGAADPISVTSATATDITSTHAPGRPRQFDRHRVALDQGSDDVAASRRHR